MLQSFERDRLLNDKPELAPVFEAYTIPAPYKAMKNREVISKGKPLTLGWGVFFYKDV
jgi:hypothetical protein